MKRSARRVWASLLACLTALNLPISIQAQSDESRPWNALVRSKLNGNEAPLWVIEARVIELLRDKQVRFDQQAPLRAIAAGRGRFKSQADVTAFVRTLERRALAISTEFASTSGVAPPVANVISRSVARPWLGELQRAAVVEANLGRLYTADFRSTITTARLKALGSALRPGVSAAEVQGAVASRSAAAGVVLAIRSQPVQTPKLEDVLNSETQAWLRTQGPDARRAIEEGLKEAIAAGRTSVDTVVASAQGAGTAARAQAGEAIQGLSQLSTSIGDVGKQLAREKEAAEALVAATPEKIGAELAKSSIVVTLNDALSTAEGAWAEHYRKVKGAVGDQQVAKAVADGQQFISQFSEFTSLLQEESSSFPRVAASVIASGRLDPKARAAVETLQAFTSSTSGLPAQAAAVVGLASVIAPNEMKQIQGVMNQVAPVLQAAAPLLMLSGFGAPVAMFSMGMGGGGGGGGNAEVMKELGAINAKLDQIIDQLNRIEKTIERQHRETMQALEALHFDVARILTRLQAQDRTAVANPCAQALDQASAPQVLRAAQHRCFEAITSRVRPNDVPEFFRLFQNLRSSADREALEEWRKMATAHSFLFDNVPGQCGPLVAASKTLDAAPQSLNQQDQSPLCAALRDREKLVDPSLVSFVVNRDRCVSRSPLITWDGSQLDSSLARWRSLLFVLNAGVGQQAALAGLAGADKISKYLMNDEWTFATSQSAAEYGSQQAALETSLKAFAALPQNALRATIDAQFGASGGGQAAYAVGYRSADTALLNSWSGIRPAAGRFVRRDGTVCFASKKLGEDRCIPASTPAEMQARRLSATGPLQVLMDSRDEMLRLVEEARITSGAAANRIDLDSLIELITLKHLQSKSVQMPASDAACTQ